jgi:hypothetical protein
MPEDGCYAETRRFVVLPSSTCSQQVSRVFILFSLDHTQTNTTVGKTPLDEGSARRRDLYLTTQTLYRRQTSMPPVGFEPAVLTSEWPQTYALDRAATGIGQNRQINLENGLVVQITKFRLMTAFFSPQRTEK